jgi:hypothetical protein
MLNLYKYYKTPDLLFGGIKGINQFYEKQKRKFYEVVNPKLKQYDYDQVNWKSDTKVIAYNSELGKISTIQLLLLSDGTVIVSYNDKPITGSEDEIRNEYPNYNAGELSEFIDYILDSELPEEV